jgi:PadR family transcriptional regulator AphA
VVRRPSLSLHEWAVLGLLVERPRHGYDIAAELRPDAPVGEVWHLPRHAVYRALERLTDLGHAQPRRTEAGHAGPQRTVFGSTPAGRRALRRWLDSPVLHLRDVRSELLLKLMLAQRLGHDRGVLVAAQRARFGPLIEERAERPGSADVVARWRQEAARAVGRFLDGLEAQAGSTERGSKP